MLAAPVLLLSGCSPWDGVTGQTGLVTGVVLSAPSCPVERIGEECPPRPVSGASVVALVGEKVTASTRSDTEGGFRLTVPFGRYVIRATNTGGYASVASEQVAVSADPIRIKLVVDSGIR